MATKDSLVESVKTKVISNLIRCVKELSVSDVLNDALAGFSRRLLQELWDGVQSMFVQELQNTEMESTATGELMFCITRLAQGTLKSQEGFELFLPPSFIEVAVLVHGIFPSLGPEHASLKDDISRLFESWWLKKGHGREEIMGNTLVYLLTKSTGPKATKSDVARVYAVCHVLDSVNFDREGAGALVDLLLQCCVLPQFLNSAQGVKFLAYLFTLNPELTKMLHQAVKNHLPATPVSWHTKFSEVYLRAWQEAKNPEMREVIEHQCIQDLMYRAVHARRGGQSSIAKVLFRILSWIHKKKTQKGVEAMLARLYEPILWRSLMAANSDVRINAAMLMFDTFPLQDADLNRQQADAALQKQFDIMHTLLSDPVPEVRLFAVRGVGNVLNIYWELIPAEVIKCFITKLIEDLAYDVSSPAVREAVLKAMQQLCDNHLCIPLLQNVLPLLRNFVHDTSERVRVAMFDLLLKVKGLRAIKFWNLVPLEHILSRLQVDSAPIVRRIMKLIHPSFVPLQEAAGEQISRCVTLVKLNMAAARQFYLNLPRCLSLEDTVSYITLLCRALIESAHKLSGKSAQSPQDDGDAAHTSKDDSAAEKKTDKTKSSKSKKKLRKTNKKQRPTADAGQDSEEEDRPEADGGLEDMAVFCGLVEAVYLMHTVVLNELDASANKEVKEGLAKKLSVMVREVMAVSKDPHLDAALVALAGHLPSRALPHIAQNLFKRLKSGSCFDESIDLKLIVKSLVLWGKAELIIQVVKDSFDSIFKNGEDSTPAVSQAGGKKSHPAKKAVAFITEEETKISPELACALITNMITPAECRHILLTKNRQDLKALIDSLKPSMAELDAYFSKTKQMSKKDVDLFFEVYTIFLRLTAFVCSRNEEAVDTREETDDEVVQVVNRSIVWCCGVVVQHVSDEVADYRDLSEALLRNVTKVCRNLMMIGLADSSFVEATVDLFQAVLREPGVCFTLKCQVLQGVYQLTQVLKYKKLPSENEKSALLNDLGCRSIDCVLTSLTKLAIVSEDSGDAENDDTANNEPEESNSQESSNGNTHKLPALISETVEIMMELTVAELNVTVVDKLVGSVLEFVLMDSKAHLKPDAAKGHDHLPPFTKSLLRIFEKRDILKKRFFDQLQTCLNSQRVNTVPQIKGVLLILELLASDLADDTLTSLYKALDSLLDEMPTADSSDTALGNLRKSVKEKLHKTVASNVEGAV